MKKLLFILFLMPLLASSQLKVDTVTIRKAVLILHNPKKPIGKEDSVFRGYIRHTGIYAQRFIYYDNKKRRIKGDITIAHFDW